MGRKRQMLLAALVAALSIITVLAGCSHVSVSSGSRRDTNLTNLNGLALVLRLATGESPNFPDSFEQVVLRMPPEMIKPELFVSPETGHHPGSLNSIRKWTDYIYLGGLPDYVVGVALVISPPENHGGKCGYVIWGDGHVSRVSAEKARQLIADPFCMDTNSTAANLNYAKRSTIVQVPQRFKRQYEDANLTNLNELGVVLRLSVRQGNRFPGSFEDVALRMPPEMLSPELFVSPDSGHRSGTMNTVAAWTDYIYVGGLPYEGIPMTPGVALVISPPENHLGKCGYVLWTGGAATRLPPEKVRQLIADPFCMDEMLTQTHIAEARKRMTLQIPKRFKSLYEKK